MGKVKTDTVTVTCWVVIVRNYILVWTYTANGMEETWQCVIGNRGRTEQNRSCKQPEQTRLILPLQVLILYVMLVVPTEIKTNQFDRQTDKQYTILPYNKALEVNSAFEKKNVQLKSDVNCKIRMFMIAEL
jgi:hypothetical protein